MPGCTDGCFLQLIAWQLNGMNMVLLHFWHSIHDSDLKLCQIQGSCVVTSRGEKNSECQGKSAVCRHRQSTMRWCCTLPGCRQSTVSANPWSKISRWLGGRAGGCFLWASQKMLPPVPCSFSQARPHIPSWSLVYHRNIAYVYETFRLSLQSYQRPILLYPCCVDLTPSCREVKYMKEKPMPIQRLHSVSCCYIAQLREIGWT